MPAKIRRFPYKPMGTSKHLSRMLFDRLNESEALEAIRLAVKDAAEGRVRPPREALEALRQQLGIRS